MDIHSFHNTSHIYSNPKRCTVYLILLMVVKLRYACGRSGPNRKLNIITYPINVMFEGPKSYLYSIKVRMNCQIFCIVLNIIRPGSVKLLFGVLLTDIILYGFDRMAI